MKTPRLSAYIVAVASVLAASAGHAQIVTNWAAYNDHRPGPTIPPHQPTVRTASGGGWGTHNRVTGYNMGAPGNTDPSPLTNFFTGAQLPVTIAVARTAGAPDDFGAINPAFGPATNSPAFRLFFGIADMSNDGIVGVDAGLEAGGTVDNVTFTFAGLNPDKRYVFRGSSARGGGYANRWAVATITNVNGWIDAHINGLTGTPGVLTSNQFPASLGAGQAAWNSGDNAEGDVIGWDFISPLPDGTFQILVEQYIGQIPGGTANDVAYGYSFGAILLAEVEVAPPVIVTHPAAVTTVEEFRPFSLSVTAEGTPLLYQWYKQGVGEITGATFPTFSVSQAHLTNSGNYYVVVHNPLGRATSSVAQVTVNDDVTPPAIRKAFSFPNVPSLTQVATLNRVIVDFAEAIQPATAGGTTQYTISGGIGNPTAVEVTSDRTVSLTLASALTPDTPYTVQVSGVVDLGGNNINSGGANNPASFRSWVSGPGNGLIYEGYNTGTGGTLDVLTNHASYPDNPFLTTNLWAFDSRIIFPDDTRQDYGGRVSGAFIPPVSANWEFFIRVYDRGEVNFNPNGLGQAGKINILAEGTGNEPRNWIRFRSRPSYLLAGEPYYIEGLYQAGSGLDPATTALKVAASLVGPPDPTPIDVPITDIDSNAIAGAEIGFPLAPKDLGGTLTISQQPANATVEELNTATFSVQVNNPSGLPVIYQWYRNGVAIEGANARVYSFQATPGDDNAAFTVRAAKIGSVVTSTPPAVLDVVPDVTAPRVVGVRSPSPFSTVVVTFSEAIQWTGNENEVFNYAVNEALPSAAAIDASGRIVTLTLPAGLTPGSSNLLTATTYIDLNNLSGPATNVVFFAGPGPLSIAQQGGGVRVSWPLPGTGMTLEESTTLTAPVPWQPVSSALYQTGPNSRYVDVAAPTGNRFYRLREP